MALKSQPEPLTPVDERAAQFMVPMRDGTRLATDLYVPANGGKDAPVILIRTMYEKSSLWTFVPLVAEYLSAEGYPVVAQDVRGKGLSEGTFSFEHGITDGYDTIDWIVNQPWGGGGVVTAGDSYPAYAGWEAVASGHPALRGVGARRVSSTLGWQFHTGDAFNLGVVALWAAQIVDNRVYDYQPPLDFSVRPLKDLLPSWLDGAQAPLWNDLTQSPGDRFWRAPAIRKVSADKIRVPAFHHGAWWDEWRGPQLRDWRIARRSTDANQYLRMEIADHMGGRLFADEEPAVDDLATEDGIRAALPRYIDPFIEFLRYEFGGGTSPQPSPVHIEVAEGGIWRGETWPPPSAREVRLHLAGGARAAQGPEGGALASEPDSVSHTASWVHDPDDLVPMLSANPIRALGEHLPDEREVENRDDVLTFTTEPMEEPLDLMGSVRLSLQVFADAPIIQVTGKLVDVFPNGRARRITEGLQQVERPDPERPVEIDLIEVGYRIRPGHRLRLEIAASCFPRWMPIIDPYGDSWSAVTGPRIEYQLTTGGRARSYLDLVVADEKLD